MQGGCDEGSDQSHCMDFKDWNRRFELRPCDDVDEEVRGESGDQCEQDAEDETHVEHTLNRIAETRPSASCAARERTGKAELARRIGTYPSTEKIQDAP